MYYDNSTTVTDKTDKIETIDLSGGTHTITGKAFNIWVYYPMPFQKELDEKLTSFPGWYGSGSDRKERDHSIDVDILELESIILLLPKNGRLEIFRK